MEIFFSSRENTIGKDYFPKWWKCCKVKEQIFVIRIVLNKIIQAFKNRYIFPAKLYIFFMISNFFVTFGIIDWQKYLIFYTNPMSVETLFETLSAIIIYIGSYIGNMLEINIEPILS